MVGDGRMGHTCDQCGLTVTVGVPDGREGYKLGGEKWWTVIRAQVPWPATCSACHDWWSHLIADNGGWVPAHALSEQRGPDA